MSRSDADRRIEELEAQLEQQRRLNAQLSRQLAKLLDDVAKLTKKPSRGRKRRKEREARSAARKDQGEPPKVPPREDTTDAKADKGVPRREPLPDHLERNVEEYPLGDVDACCATPVLEQRDSKILERKTLIPARTAVKRVELHRAQCVCCGTLHTAKTPPLAMPNGSMSAALIAYIVHGKCGLHLPLKRIMEVLLETGLRMAKSTLSNVMRHAAQLLTPVYDRIVAALFAEDLLHVDGTGIKALTPGETGSHRGQIAVYCNATLTAYAYSENKEGRHIRDFLRVGKSNGYRGRLVADAANNMDQLYRDGTIQECGCWYHARDKFTAAEPGAPNAAAEAKAWIGTLFDVEKRADRAGDTAAERRGRRKRDSIPLLRGFYRWMNTTQHRYAPDEELWKAIQYCRNHWGPLTRFMTDGSIPMTNNLAERELGVFGRGRKNWLFAGSDAAGDWLAILHTVVRTCQRLSIAPFEYLRWVLPKLSDLPVNRGKGTLALLTPMAYASEA